MKKILSTFLMISALALVPVAPTPAAVASPVSRMSLAEMMELYKPCPRGTVKVRRHTSTKKKVVNSLIAGGVGAAVGGGLGGGRGALLGAGAGAGGYLTYRYIRDRRGRCVLRRA